MALQVGIFINELKKTKMGKDKENKPANSVIKINPEVWIREQNIDWLAHPVSKTIAIVHKFVEDSKEKMENYSDDEIEELKEFLIHLREKIIS